MSRADGRKRSWRDGVTPLRIMRNRSIAHHAQSTLPGMGRFDYYGNDPTTEAIRREYENIMAKKGNRNA